MSSEDSATNDKIILKTFKIRKTFSYSINTGSRGAGKYSLQSQKLVDDGYLESMPHYSGLEYGTVDSDDFVQWPKASDKNTLS